MAVENIQGANHTAYAIIRNHQRDEGLLALPVYGTTDAPCAIVRTHAPIESLVIYWRAEREGGPPLVPHPSLFDSNNVFLRGGRSTQAPMLLPALSAHTWSIWGEYHYAVSTPVGLDMNFNTGVNPLDQALGLAATDTTIPGNNFQTGILDTVASAAQQQPGTDKLTMPSDPPPETFTIDPTLNPLTFENSPDPDVPAPLPDLMTPLQAYADPNEKVLPESDYA